MPETPYVPATDATVLPVYRRLSVHTGAGNGAVYAIAIEGAHIHYLTALRGDKALTWVHQVDVRSVRSD
jgi:hypothetical protein